MKTFQKALFSFCCFSALHFTASCGALEHPFSAQLPQTQSFSLLSPGPYKVAHIDADFVDNSRETASNGRYLGAPERTLPTRIFYPAVERTLEFLRPGAPPIHSGGAPHPLVVYSHGFMSFREECTYLAEHLASYGFVVAAPNFPLTNYFAPGDPTLSDVVNQPEDISFIIDSLLQDSPATTNPFPKAIDPNRIAAVGLSLGGLTTSLLTFHTDLKDERIAAAVAIAPPTFMFNAEFFKNVSTPFMVIGGDIDAIVPYPENFEPLVEIAPQTWLVTLNGASHTGFADIAHLIFRWHHNPDSVGCSQIEKHLPEDPNFLADLGVEGQGIELGKSSRPCQLERFPKAMSPKAQHTLTALAVSSFLQGVFQKQVSEETLVNTLKVIDMEQKSLDIVSPRTFRYDESESDTPGIIVPTEEP